MPFKNTEFLNICTNDIFVQFKRRASIKSLNYKHIAPK